MAYRTFSRLQAIHPTGMQAGSPTVAPSLARLLLPPDTHRALGTSQRRININGGQEGGEAGAEVQEGSAGGIQAINGVLVIQNMRRGVHISRTIRRLMSAQPLAKAVYRPLREQAVAFLKSAHHGGNLVRWTAEELLEKLTVLVV